MTDFLELLLDLPQEEEEMGLELRLPSEGRRPDTAVEHVQGHAPGGAAEGMLLSKGPAEETLLPARLARHPASAETETPVQAGTQPRGELWVKVPVYSEVRAGTLPQGETRTGVPPYSEVWARQGEYTASGVLQPRKGEEAPGGQTAPVVRRFSGFAGLPDRAVEAVWDALDRGAAFPLAQHSGSGQYAGAAAVRYSRVSASEFSAGGAAVLEHRLARSGVRPAAVQRMDGDQITVEAEPDLEELDRRVRRDARRYDGALTLY